MSTDQEHCIASIVCGSVDLYVTPSVSASAADQINYLQHVMTIAVVLLFLCCSLCSYL